jgi:tetratricopeptide (TPR) repeat protein
MSNHETAAELKKKAETFLWKYNASDNDQDIAASIFKQAIEKCNDRTLDNVQIADCYCRLALTYRKKKEKHEEDFKNAVDASSAIFSLSLPSWYDFTEVIELLINPERYDFNEKYKDFEKAKLFSIRVMDSDRLYQVGCRFASKEDVTEEELDFAMKYFNLIIERNHDITDHTVSMAHCRIAMIYIYEKEKTKENFDKGIEHFEKSISRKRFLERDTQQICIPFCQYAIVLQRASDIGYSEQYENHEKADQLLKKMEDVFNRNPVVLYYKAGEQYQFHKLANDYYYDLAEKYYIIALKHITNEISTKVLLKLYLGKINIKRKDKSFDLYCNAIDNFVECIELALSLKGEGYYVSSSAMHSLQKILILLNEPETYLFSSDFAKSDKVLQTIEWIKSMKEKFCSCNMVCLNKVIGSCSETHVVKLNKSDNVFLKRQKSVVKKKMHASENEESVYEKEIQKLMGTKKKLAEIQNNQDLYEYYNGFLTTISQVYIVSIVIKSGQLSLNTSNPAVTVVSKLVSLIPLIGSHISSAGEALWDFMKGVQMKNKAMNVVKFSTTSDEFNEMVQEVLVDFISENKDKIIEMGNKSDEIVDTWYKKLAKFCSDIKSSIEESIWVQEFETPMQKIGNKDASELISEWLSSGKIYEGQIPIRVPIGEKKDRLLKYIIVITEKAEEQEEKESTQSDCSCGSDKNNEPIKSEKTCCEKCFWCC